MQRQRQRWQHRAIVRRPLPAIDLRRARAALLLLAGVLLLHGWLLALWPAQRRIGVDHRLASAPRPRSVLVATLAPVATLARPALPAQTPAAAGAAPGAARAAAPPVQAPAPAPSPAAPLVGARHRATRTVASSGVADPGVTHNPRTEQAVAAVPVAPGGAKSVATAAAPAPRAETAQRDVPRAPPPAPGEPPPLYPTRVPAPVQLHYALRYNGESGHALLRWQPDAAAGQPPRYALTLVGQTESGRALVEQDSHGRIDAAGLAPERFLDRRGGRGWRAAHFSRWAVAPEVAASAPTDAPVGEISFSGPQVRYPAWLGAQDRLSWLVQLVAIAGAAQDAVGAASATASAEGAAGAADWRLFVVDTRGRAETWRLQLLGSETVDTPLGRQRALHLRHEPERSDGLRIDAWLDPARGHWPLRLRHTAVRSGDVFELLLDREPEAP